MKRAVVIMTAALAAASLSACGMVGNKAGTSATSNAPTDPSSAPSGSDGQATGLDTGDYFAKYSVPTRATDANGGRIAESVEIGRRMLLPVEIDPKYSRGGGATWIPSAGRLSMNLTNNYLAELDKYEDRYQSGYYVSADSADGDAGVTTFIMRYDSQQTAEDVALRLGTVAQTDGAKLVESDPQDPSKPVFVDLKGRVYITQVFDRTNNSISVESITNYNEYLVYTFVNGSDDTQQKVDFLRSYYEKQFPLLELAETHRTEAGFGKLDGWVGMDNKEGLLRYALRNTSDEDFFHTPGIYNKRMVASTFVENKEMLTLLDQAGVEDSAMWQTLVIPTRNKDAAEMLRSGMFSINMENEFKEIEPAQQLPNTRCLTKTEALGMTQFACIMVYENYVFATTTNTSDEVNEDAAKKLAGQRIAAQYAIFQDAKSNPDGTKRPDASAPATSEESPAPVTESRVEGIKR